MCVYICPCYITSHFYQIANAALQEAAAKVSPDSVNSARVGSPDK